MPQTKSKNQQADGPPVSERLLSSASLPTITTVIGPKGGVGKSLTSRCVICRYHAAGIVPRIVQIDRTPALSSLYGDHVVSAALPSTDEQRADPLAAMVALEPLAAAIDATMGDGRPLVTDVGSGPSAAATVEYIGKGRLDQHMKDKARSVVIVVMTSDPSVMSTSIDLAEALETAHPGAHFVVALNRRDGTFRFFPGSPADEVLRRRVQPFAERHRSMTIPAIPAGALLPFEALHLPFTAIIESEPDVLARRLGMSRTLAAVLQGDVGEWLSLVWGELDEILPLQTGGSNG